MNFEKVKYGFMRAAQYTGEAVQTAWQQRDADIFLKGHHTAGMLCLEIMQQKVDVMMQQMGSEKPLSEKDQYLYAKLVELKKETEEQLLCNLETHLYGEPVVNVLPENFEE